jgi:NADPH:quinone reductase-like Zn-dependent oxidoreductase
MRAAIISSQGPVASAVLKVVSDWPEPDAPGPGQCRVRTLCSALNHLDLWVARGVPGLKLSYPRVGGSDACGVVDGVGPGVSPAWVGRRVILNAAVAQPEPTAPGEPPEPLEPAYEVIGEHTHGTHAELFNAPVANLQAISSDADPAGAAAFGLTHLTAYSMMVGKAKLRPGQWVLVTGIGGGVAGAALAIARAWGCPTVVTSRHQWKLDKAVALGATHGVLDSGEDWSRQVRALTAGRGVDLAVDSSGKATHLKCLKSLARAGAYVTPGCTSGPDATTDLARIFWHQLRIIGSTMGTSEEFAQLAALYREGVFRPVVDAIVPFGEAARAYERLEAGEQFGKVVLDWRAP